MPVTATPYTAAEDQFLFNTFITTLVGAVGTSFGFATSNGNQALPRATIAYSGSTTSWPGSGTVDVFHNKDIIATFTYAGKTGSSLTGCSGGSGTINSGDQMMVRITETWTVNDSPPTQTGGAAAQTPFWATIDGRGNVKMEMVKVTSVGSAPYKTWTVVRGQDSQAVTHSSTARVQSSLSKAAGYLGSDNNVSVDLGGGRFLWCFNDPNWQAGPGLGRIGFPGIRNALAIQTGSDLGTATMAFYGPAARGGMWNYGIDELFPDTVNPDGSDQPIGMWANNGIMIDGLLVMTFLMTGTLVGQETIGQCAVYVDNPTAAPTSWHFRKVPMWCEGAGGRAVGGSLLLDPGDGYVYFMPATQRGGGLQANVNGGFFYLGRWLRTDVKKARLLNPQFWCGPTVGWSHETPNKLKARALNLNSQIQPFCTQASIHKRADGKWQLSSTDSNHLQYATIPATPSTQQFPAVANVYNIPNYGQGFAYVGFAHPEQTWSGKAANDVLMSFNPGFSNSQTHPEVYYPHFVKIAGI